MSRLRSFGPILAIPRAFPSDRDESAGYMRARIRLPRVPPLALLTLALAVASCARPVDPLPGYTRASGEELASLTRAVADYYTVRARAFVAGDPAVLFAVYPGLAEGEDVRNGINLDAFRLVGWRELEVTKVEHRLQSYEPARIYLKGASAVAFVHGSEHFEVRGGTSAGEFFTRIDLVNYTDRWVVIRTDEQTMAEPPPRVPDR